jgi:ABC-2 type transport system ATP-binding protein
LNPPTRLCYLAGEDKNMGAPPARNSTKREDRLDPWLQEQNFDRPHASLKLNAPASRLCLDRKKLLSARPGRDGESGARVGASTFLGRGIAPMDDGLVAERLTKRFGRTVALDQVSFAVPDGAVFALVGANGAGKTTLIRILMNIARPTEGRALVVGRNSEDLGGTGFCEVGYVSENQDLADWTTVGGMLDYFRPFYPRWDLDLEGRLVRQFDLPLKRKLKHLSRGMRMKAAFVSSLAYRPKLLVLDEPLSGLDPFVRDELIESLREQAAGTTVFLSSHDLAEIESFASHVGFLEEGRMLFSEPLAALMGRFREGIAIGGSRPETAPAEWLNFEAAKGGFRWVHSGYRGAESEAEARAVFGDGVVEFRPMPLRSVFLAMAKAGRTRKMAEGRAA